MLFLFSWIFLYFYRLIISRLENNPITMTTWLCYTKRVHIKKKGEFIKDHIQVK